MTLERRQDDADAEMSIALQLNSSTTLTFDSMIAASLFRTQVHCVPKNIPNIFDCNLKNNYQILIIFGTNISNTICNQMTV